MTSITKETFEVRVPNKETRKAIAEARQGGGAVHKGKTADILRGVAKSND